MFQFQIVSLELDGFDLTVSCRRPLSFGALKLVTGRFHQADTLIAETMLFSFIDDASQIVKIFPQTRKFFYFSRRIRVLAKAIAARPQKWSTIASATSTAASTAMTTTKGLSRKLTWPGSWKIQVSNFRLRSVRWLESLLMVDLDAKFLVFF